jgi:hypothetical protein
VPIDEPIAVVEKKFEIKSSPAKPKVVSSTAKKRSAKKQQL